MALRVIQLGVGGFGKEWRKAITETAKAKVVCLVDLDPEALKEGAKFFGVPPERCFDKADADWSKMDADVVIDSTPHMVHYEHTLKAFATGKDLIVVKPMSDKWETAVAMFEKARTMGRKLIVGQQMRFHPVIQKIHKIIDSGKLGKLGYILLDVFFTRKGPVRPKWFQPYPLLVELSVHHFDFLRFTLGTEARYVRAESWNAPWMDNTKGETSACCIFEMEDNAKVIYRSLTTLTDHTAWPGRWYIEGEKGVLTVIKGQVYLNGKQLEVEPIMGIENPNIDIFNMEIMKQYLNYAAGGPEPATSGRNNLNSMRMVFGAIDSTVAGQRINLLSGKYAIEEIDEK